MMATARSAETGNQLPQNKEGRETGEHYGKLVGAVNNELNWRRLFATAIIIGSPLLLLAACNNPRIDIQAVQASGFEQSEEEIPTEVINSGKIARPAKTSAPRPTQPRPTPEPTQTPVPHEAFKAISQPESIKESDPFVQEIVNSATYENNVLTENGQTTRLVWAQIDKKNLNEAIGKAIVSAVDMGADPNLAQAMLSNLVAIRFAGPANYWIGNRHIQIVFPGLAAHEAGHALGGSFAADSDSPDDELLATAISEMVAQRLYNYTYPWDKTTYTDLSVCGRDQKTKQQFMLEYNRLVDISKDLEKVKYPHLWAQIVTAHGNFEQSQIADPLGPDTDLSRLNEGMPVSLLINNHLAGIYNVPASQIRADLLQMAKDACDLPDN